VSHGLCSLASSIQYSDVGGEEVVPLPDEEIRDGSADLNGFVGGDATMVLNVAGNMDPRRHDEVANQDVVRKRQQFVRPRVAWKADIEAPQGHPR
jgi:hypothetical protein